MVRKYRLLSAAAALLLMGLMFLLVYAKQHGQPARTVSLESAADPAQTADDTGDIARLTTESTTEYPIPSYPQVELSVDPVEPTEADIRVEAEECSYSGSLEVTDAKPGYSGDGYLAGFSQSPGDACTATIEVPASQHYDVTISVSAEQPVTNALLLNGEKIGEFTIKENEHFVRVTFSGVYIKAGKATLSIEEMDGFFALDYFEVSNYDEMYSMEYRKNYELSDPKASPGARKLMQFLSDNYGKKIITGQHCASASGSEMELIYRMTGKYPAIRFGDVEGYSANSTIDAGDIIGSCEAWAEQGGIVGLMWHWDAPSGVSSVYKKETDFSLLDALPPYKVINDILEPPTEAEATEDASGTTEETAEPTEPTTVDDSIPTDPIEPEFVQRFEFTVDVASLKPEEIRKLVEDGKLSPECEAIIQDIDTVSETLKPLAEKDIPVIWRPLHEAGGDWFWWGADGVEPYRWLWDTMYRRMTEYHGLHNLIWVWNGQSEEYLVDNYDIASLDIYLSPDKPFGSRYEQFVTLSRMTGGEKIIAMSECSSVPDVNLMFRDNTIWSYFGLWYGDYIVDDKGMYTEMYTKAEDLVSMYNSEAAITLEDAAKLKQ
ncbi:MAG: hypothetical protein IKN55_10865 [Oscillospiraceae bacterium]|nr:hypothetical protein [Oscillospiraceae bacterium]